MNLLRAVRTCLATTAVLALFACTPPSAPQSVSEPSVAISRVRVVNDSATDLSGLRLLFPKDDVEIGEVAAGAASGYVTVPRGVYGYSAFSVLRDGEQVIQPVIDFVGESPLPIDDYTYVLGVDNEGRIELLTVMRVDPAAEPSGSGVTWVRVVNEGPDDLAGYGMRYSDDQQIYFGSVPAGSASQYARHYAGSGLWPDAVQYTEAGTTLVQPVPGSADDRQPTGSSERGRLTYVVRYDRDAPEGRHVEHVRVDP